MHSEEINLGVNVYKFIFIYSYYKQNKKIKARLKGELLKNIIENLGKLFPS